MTRVDVLKTWKLFIRGEFPRSESGRTLPVRDPKGRLLAHACLASRKDLRDAVESARSAQGGWADRSAYNRGQILYRLAEMVEGRSAEFIAALREATGATAAEARKETEASIDRLVAFAGWCDKFAAILGTHNPVAGPHYNFTIPEATGIVAVVAPDQPALLGLISLLAPPLCAGNTVIALVSEAHPIPGLLLGESAATADCPGGVLNLLSGTRKELLPEIVKHRGIDAIHAANVSDAEAALLRSGAAENLKRVSVREVDEDQWGDSEEMTHPWWIEPFVDFKTIWHPARI